MYGLSTKNSGRLLRCGEVAVSGGSTVAIIASANANVFQATVSLHPKSIIFLGGENRPLEIRLCSQGKVITAFPYILFFSLQVLKHLVLENG